MERRRDLIVIGGSAGGLPALRALLAALPATLPAAVLAVLHQAPRAGRLGRALAPASSLPLAVVHAPEPLRRGEVRLAPPGRHLVVRATATQGERACLSDSPSERHARPAIDALFRSAAAAFGSRTVAVLLSGLLDDGVRGLDAVRRAGGVTVVQDPREAACADLPSRAIEAMAVDHVLALDAIAPRLAALSAEPAPARTIPRDIVLEASLYDEADSVSAAACASERALWLAVRTLDERAAMLGRMADAAGQGTGDGCGLYRRQAEELQQQERIARRFLLALREREIAPSARRSGDAGGHAEALLSSETDAG